LPANSQKKGYQVVLFSKHAKTLEKTIIVSDEDLGQKYEVSPYLITDQMKDVFNRTDFVFITYPSFLFPTLATEIFKCDLNKIPLVFCSRNGRCRVFFPRTSRERNAHLWT
jgi:hypothetical protein